MQTGTSTSLTTKANEFRVKFAILKKHRAIKYIKYNKISLSNNELLLKDESSITIKNNSGRNTLIEAKAFTLKP